MLDWIKKFLQPEKPPVKENVTLYSNPCKYSYFGYEDYQYGYGTYIRHLDEDIVEYMWYDVCDMHYTSRYTGTSKCGKEFHMRSLPSMWLKDVANFGELIAQPLIRAELNFLNRYGRPLSRKQE